MTKKPHPLFLKINHSYSSITYLLHGVRILSILNILRFAMINNQAAHFSVTVNAPAMSSPASPCSAVVGLGRACLVDLPEWEVFSWEARCAHSDHINAGRWYMGVETGYPLLNPMRNCEILCFSSYGHTDRPYPPFKSQVTPKFFRI